MTETEKALEWVDHGFPLIDIETSRKHLETIRKALQGADRIAHLDDALSVAHDEIRVLKAKSQGLLRALETIEEITNDEIKARFKCPDRAEEKCAGKSVIYSLLCIPRNIAREAIKSFNSDETGVGL